MDGWRWLRSQTETLRIFDFTEAGELKSEIIVSELSGYGRLRTPMLGPDNALYITTSNGGDGGGADKILRLSATSANSAPEFDPETDTRSVAENTDGGQSIGAPITATDADGDTLTYSLGGTNADDFAIDTATGQLQTQVALDYETKSSYTVTVTATDPSGETDSITVTISVTNVDEAGSVSFSRTTPLVGAALTATLTDPDGGVTNVSWNWFVSRGPSYVPIIKAKSDSYTPEDVDLASCCLSMPPTPTPTGPTRGPATSRTTRWWRRPWSSTERN